jgi:hypothetical protein
VADSVCAICELLPGAQTLMADQLRLLLRTALPGPDSSTISHICSLPAAQELRVTGAAQADIVQSLLRATAGRAPSFSSRSRSSSPSSDGRLGRGLSSSGSSSSSPVSRRSRRSAASSECGLRGGSSSGRGVGVGALCQQLSGAKLLQPECLEELLLPC